MNRRASFQPVAIVGQACLLPGVCTPGQLWDAVLGKQDLLGDVPRSYWRLSDANPAARPAAQGDSPEGIATRRGGHVEGFEELFDPEGFAVPAAEIIPLDPLCHWILHAARECLRSSATRLDPVADSLNRAGPPEAACRPAQGSVPVQRKRGGLILGNLSYPSAGLAGFAERVWLGLPPSDPRNRFCSGFPVQFAARALGLEGPAFAIDAACSSSLYAIKLACDRLHDGSADFMLAGGANRADNLFLHIGFHALGASSPSGQSRPFHRDADGLIPSEGIATVLLKRLEDAEAAGDRILGVIRGIGLSNDGRGQGLLVPSAEGQAQSIREAYRMAGIRPAEIQFVECHATGTAVGDATEVASMARIFGEDPPGARIPIGSLKSNLGHSITAAGAAGLLKVLAAFEHQTLPPSRYTDAPLALLDASPFRVIGEAEPWSSEGPRLAAVSAFGFGGNNAHLIVEEWRPAPGRTGAHPAVPAQDSVAVVGIGLSVGELTNARQFAQMSFGDGERKFRLEIDRIEIPAADLKFPPRDLERSLPQQVAALKCAMDAVADAGELPKERTSVFIGMQCDVESARYGARWRLPDLPGGEHLSGDSLIRMPLGPAGVLGSMPNVVTNRINSQFDFRGPSFSVSSEETSGITALDLAVRALVSGEADAAIAGAVDLCAEPVHEAARNQIAGARIPGADASVVFVLKRRADARRDGNRIYALIEPAPSTASGVAKSDPPVISGCAHAADGMLQVLHAVLAAHLRVCAPDAGRPSLPRIPGEGQETIEAGASTFTGHYASIRIRQEASDAGNGWLTPSGFAPAIRCFSGKGPNEILRAVRRGHESADGPARLVIVSAEPAEYERQRVAAAEALEGLAGGRAFPAGKGIYYQPATVEGGLAFVFTFAAASYPGMGRELLLAVPELLDVIRERFAGAAQRLSWLCDPAAAQPSHIDQLRGFSLLCHAHTRLSRGILGLEPGAALGISSGESSSLFCLDGWDDPEAMFREIEDSGLYTRQLAGEFRAVERAWRKRGAETPVRWMCCRVFLAADEVAAALAGEPLLHLLIIHAPEDCLIGGDRAACERVMLKLGRRHCLPVENGMAAHCPEVGEFSNEWLRLHRRPTKPIPGIRFYGNAGNRHYALSSESVGDALLGQALRTVDFPATVRQAWDDGVRVFVEHGPWGLCSGWMSQILKDREHVAVSLDRAGESPVRQVLEAAGELLAAGIRVDIGSLIARLAPAAASMTAPARTCVFPGHFPKVEFPPVRPAEPPARAPAPAPPQAMPPAPPVLLALDWLPPAADRSHPARAFFQLHSAIHRQWVDSQLATQRLFLESRQRVFEYLQGAIAVEEDETTDFEDSAVAEELAVAPVAPPFAAPVWKRAAGMGPRTPCGPSYTRDQLVTLSQGKISDVFGALFAFQDDFHWQVRMPTPPLLLADRVLGIDCEPLVMGTGTIWTETDIRRDSWYLHEGRIPPGVMIEAGQADLLLISWMGADRHNQGERVYRLLGCELTYHGSLPKAGDTIRYEISVDSHARHEGIRLFFFHYDATVHGQPCLTVRRGQAGFFTAEELADSMGILWVPETAEAPIEDPLDPPEVVCQFSKFTREQVVAFSEGRPFDCFGKGFELLETHVMTPRIAAGKMLLFDEVEEFDPRGGPWGRGYLRAVTHIQPDHWFFDGHFLNDPCMPGTLMTEGAMQAMAFYLAAMGYTLERDGWRFEPVPEQTIHLRCRGQVVPSSQVLVCELFVREVTAGPIPSLTVDLLGSVDGQRAILGQNLGFRLVPDWPLTRRPELLERYGESRHVARVNGFEFGYSSLLACAWGKPTDAFGPMYREFDGHRRVARLPGPPYHFMTRVAKIEGEMGVRAPGAYAELEYDIPPEAWYFEENDNSTMPFCVLIEAALQPCGWLASYLGCSLAKDEDLAFRNLDGTGTQLIEIKPGAKRLVTKVRVTRISGAGGMIILGFDVRCELDGVPAYKMDTVFGFFPIPSLRSQAGLPITPDQRAAFDEPPNIDIDLRTYPEKFFRNSPALPASRLLMIDRITGFWPEGGKAGLGRIRAEKYSSPSEWFFKAHFFQDSVQPGSLGLQGMLQVLQFYMLGTGMAEGMADARFEPIALDTPLTWKYRGQVLPASEICVNEMEIVERGTDERGPFVVGSGSAWVDGKRIYEVRRMGMRIVPGRRLLPPKPRIEEFWSGAVGRRHPLIANFYQSMIDQFIEEITVTDRRGLEGLRGKPVLYLANHQTQIESGLFLIAMAAMTERLVVALANAKHERRWLGELVRRTFSAPGMRDPRIIRYFDQSRPESLSGILEDLRKTLVSGECSVLIHAGGTREIRAGQPVLRISAASIDLALGAGVPIVPVAFTRGLPEEPLRSRKLEFPAGYGRQRYVVGSPIPPAALAALSLVERKRRILDAIESLRRNDVPAPPDLGLARSVRERRAGKGCGEVTAVLSLFAEAAMGTGGTLPGDEDWLRDWKQWLQIESHSRP